MDWRDRTLWNRIGYAFTVGWIALILLITGGNADDPLIDLIFIVPLGAWIVGLTVARLIRGRLGGRVE